MSKRKLMAMIASMTVAIVATWSTANATVYNFMFSSQSEFIVGQLTVDMSDNEVTNITGTLSGLVNDTINGSIANSSFANPVSLPDNAFIYDNIFYPGQELVLDQYGVVFTTAGNPGGYWDLLERRARRLCALRVQPRRRLSDYYKRRQTGSGLRFRSLRRG